MCSTLEHILSFHFLVIRQSHSYGKRCVCVAVASSSLRHLWACARLTKSFASSVKNSRRTVVLACLRYDSQPSVGEELDLLVTETSPHSLLAYGSL
ncbi:hypothetical protein E2C01_089665 [Portunus trituberculatus]|uniref:Uncharacterized protein n=1 Tax=Portunus trituberculatus TaxID=210409 RepID=A0A5B7JQ76_PORTR|nr:hypothetical protein [Portunus trituberculatus]